MASTGIEPVFLLAASHTTYLALVSFPSPAIAAATAWFNSVLTTELTRLSYLMTASPTTNPI